MLDHIHIQNYRLFKDLKIDKLGQVNLIAGKNNTGKTALLEALRILASPPHTNNVINNILLLRNELTRGSDTETYKNLYYKRILDDKQTIIKINDLNIIHTKLKAPIHNIFDIKNWGRLDSGQYGIEPIDGLIYIPFIIEDKLNTTLWENISLTRLEDDVIKILNVIEPKIEKIRIENDRAKVVLIGETAPIQLKSLGDGINRLLTIALAIVNAKDKILILDEFEVGLHHRVQRQLWEIVFEYAKKWNIQVFVTTHSQDTIENFYYIANTKEFLNMGCYFVLSKGKDNMVAINYDMEEISLAITSNIEIR